MPGSIRHAEYTGKTPNGYPSLAAAASTPGGRYFAPDHCGHTQASTSNAPSSSSRRSEGKQTASATSPSRISSRRSHSQPQHAGLRSTQFHRTQEAAGPDHAAKMQPQDTQTQPPGPCGYAVPPPVQTPSMQSNNAQAQPAVNPSRSGVSQRDFAAVQAQAQGPYSTSNRRGSVTSHRPSASSATTRSQARSHGIQQPPGDDDEENYVSQRSRDSSISRRVDGAEQTWRKAPSTVRTQSTIGPTNDADSLTPDDSFSRVGSPGRSHDRSESERSSHTSRRASSDRLHPYGQTCSRMSTIDEIPDYSNDFIYSQPVRDAAQHQRIPSRAPTIRTISTINSDDLPSSVDGQSMPSSTSRQASSNPRQASSTPQRELYYPQGFTPNVSAPRAEEKVEGDDDNASSSCQCSSCVSSGEESENEGPAVTSGFLQPGAQFGDVYGPHPMGYPQYDQEFAQQPQQYIPDILYVQQPMPAQQCQPDTQQQYPPQPLSSPQTGFAQQPQHA